VDDKIRNGLIVISFCI